MNTETILRARKASAFRASLTAEQRASLPECPAGTSFPEIDEVAARDAAAGSSSRAARMHPSSGFCHPHCAL